MKQVQETTVPRKFDKVLSLGRACDTAFQIRRHFKQREAYPFDWLVTPYPALINLLERDFSGFLLDENLQADGKYVVDKGSGIAMMHDFETPALYQQTLDVVRAKYQRRIKRWLSLVNGGASILFVRSQQYVDHNNLGEEQSRALLKLLQQKYKNAKVHLLVQNPPGAAIPEVVEKNFWLLQLKPPDPWEWSGDDAAWSEMFQRVKRSMGRLRRGWR